jgi:hypothetical protein
MIGLIGIKNSGKDEEGEAKGGEGEEEERAGVEGGGVAMLGKGEVVIVENTEKGEVTQRL